VTLSVWMLWAGLATSLSIPLLPWPIMFVAAGTFIAIAVVIASIALPQTQLDYAVKPLRHVSIPAIILGFGILLQIMPAQFSGLAQPLWSAMSAAIQQPSAGFITVDTSITAVVLTKYLVIVGTVLAVALVSSDQRRGSQTSNAIAWLLAAFYAAFLVKASLSTFQPVAISKQLLTDWTSLSTLGVLMSGATLVHFRSQQSGKRLRSNARPSREYVQLFLAGAVMVGLFAIPLIVDGSQAAIIPAVCAIAAFLTVLFIKQLAVGPAGAIFATVLVICGLWLAAVAFGITGPRSSEVLGKQLETDIATIVRIFRDFSWFGSGAGTYSQLVPMYEGSKDQGTGFLYAPPTALSLLVELGIPLTLLAAIVLFASGSAAFRAVVRSGRDYSKATLGCSSYVYVVAAAFTPGASLSFSTLIVAVTLVSLGVFDCSRTGS